MADIKTRDVVKGSIKTIDKAAVAGERMKQAYISKGAMPNAMQDMWHKIVSEFFPTSGYQPTYEMDIEAYTEENMGSPDYRSEIWVPVIMWSLISRTVWDFEERINKVLAEKYFSDIVPVNRTFSCVAVAYTDEQYPEFDFYGSDGIDATSIGGYKSVFASNIYGKRIDKHFHCGHNLSHDNRIYQETLRWRFLSIHALFLQM